MVSSVWIVAREVEKIDSGKDDEETAEQGDGVYGGRGVEALEEKERCDQCACRKCYVVKWVNAG